MVNCPEMEHFGLYIAVMCPKDADGMANSVGLWEPSDLGLHGLLSSICPNTYNFYDIFFISTER